MLDQNIKRQASLEQLLKLRYPAVAVKLLENLEDAPEGTIYPMEAWGKHIALCQAFGYARRQNKIICLRTEDQWCWTPLMCYGFKDGGPGTKAFEYKVRGIGTPDREKAEAFVNTLPKLPQGKCKGILLAPLTRCDFEPDVTLIYCENHQLRLILMAVFSQSGKLVDSSFMPLESCIYSVIPPIEDGEYRITLPDPGETERALTRDNEIIFSIPAGKSDEFWSGIEYQKGRGISINSFYPGMKEDFGRPPFYDEVFESWGLETGEAWDK